MNNEIVSVSYYEKLDLSISVRVIPTNPADRRERLCEAVMEHLLECDTCLGSIEAVCPEYVRLQRRLNACGVPVRGQIVTC